MATYSKAASKSVESTTRRRKAGTLKSGSGKTVRSRKQAIAIGLNETRERAPRYREKPRARASALARSARSWPYGVYWPRRINDGTGHRSRK